MKPIVIFGAGDIAEIAHFYFTQVAQRSVAAFAVDAEFVKEATFCGHPVLAVETLPSDFEPAGHDAFVALSYNSMNRLRAEKCAQMKSAGYSLTGFVSPKATNYATSIGENAFILEDNTIQPFVRIGDNVTLWSGNHIGHHSVVTDNVFISSHVVISGGVKVGENCFLGVNATIRDHVTLAPFTLVGAGGIINADTEAEGVYMVGEHTELRKIKSTRLKKI